MTSRILVLSDLHAFIGEDGDNAPSLMSMLSPGGKGVELFKKCADVVKTRFDTIDAIFVAGDLTNKADAQALNQVWSALNKLAGHFDAPLIATAGNHDYDSRGQSSSNARASLIDLEPHFPFDNEEAKMRYFTYDFAEWRGESFTVVVINSAAQHGYGEGADAELRHGRVTLSARKRIARAIQTRDSKLEYFALVHHQPTQLPGLDHDETSTMIDGHELLEVLGPDLLVIHGHKHRPYLQWAAGGADSALLFSASSFAANTGGGTFGAAAPNQFHVIETASLDEKNAAGISMGGSIFTWTFDSFDWQPASLGTYFPAESGYGWRGSTSYLGGQVTTALDENDGLLDTSEIRKTFPQLAFLPYQELKRLEGQMRASDARVSFSFEPSGRLREIARDEPLDESLGGNGG